MDATADDDAEVNWSGTRGDDATWDENEKIHTTQISWIKTDAPFSPAISIFSPSLSLSPRLIIISKHKLGTFQWKFIFLHGGALEYVCPYFSHSKYMDDQQTLVVTLTQYLSLLFSLRPPWDFLSFRQNMWLLPRRNYCGRRNYSIEPVIGFLFFFAIALRLHRTATIKRSSGALHTYATSKKKGTKKVTQKGNLITW